jgi:hypothetical protein
MRPDVLIRPRPHRAILVVAALFFAGAAAYAISSALRQYEAVASADAQLVQVQRMQKRPPLLGRAPRNSKRTSSGMHCERNLHSRGIQSSMRWRRPAVPRSNCSIFSRQNRKANCFEGAGARPGSVNGLYESPSGSIGVR